MYYKFEIFLTLRHTHWDAVLETLGNAIDTHRPGAPATIYEVVNGWRGETEPTMLIQILSMVNIETIINKIAGKLRNEFAQERVTVTTEQVTE